MKVLLTLLALVSSVAFAQTITPNDVCSKVARTNGSNGAVCAQIISRNVFDQASLNLAFKAVDMGSIHAVEILKAAANRRMDFLAGEVCERVVVANGENGVRCAQAVVDAVISPELAQIAIKVVSQGSIHAVNALTAGANAYLFPPAAQVCEAMAALNGSNTALCVQVIANKVVMNGAEQTCMSVLSSGSSSALSCLRNVVTDYMPVPQPQRVLVDVRELIELKKTVMKARAMLDRGMVDQSRRNMDEASLLIDQLLNRNF